MNLAEVLSVGVCNRLLVEPRSSALSWENIESKPPAKAKIRSPAEVSRTPGEPFGRILRTTTRACNSTPLRKELIAVRHRAAAVLSIALAVATAVLAGPAPARAAVDGFDVTITELPARFTAGSAARTVTVVASAEPGQGCRKVRWSMLLKVGGGDLDEVKVDRVEEDGSFPLQVQTDGGTARLTDVQLDPGRLCPGRTVTARYQVAFTDGAREGRVTFQAQAFDADARLLEEASASSRVVGDAAAASPSPTPSESESADAAEEEDTAEEGAAGGDEASTPPAAGDDLAADRASSEGGVPSLLGPGLVIGAVLVFLGVSLLLRLRLRNRAAKALMNTTAYPVR
jgi:hypothetical protein